MKTTNLKRIKESFSLTERIIFSVFFAVFVISGICILNSINNKFLVEIPIRGGKITEGVVGTPRLINPLTALSETDRNMIQLIYSGLMKSNSDGLQTDLADRYDVSEDGLSYHFYIKEDAIFHDGEPVTADDVIFTVLAAQNPELKSPKRSNWEGISVEKINDKEIIFRLNQPYSPFLQNMTLGIVPKHVWSDININEFTLSKFNLEPIGSGPYKISKIKKDSIGIPTSYILESNKKYALGRPFVDELVFNYYRNQRDLMEAYNNSELDSVYGINPKEARALQIDGHRVETYTLPRIFAIFFNQNENALLAEKSVREALKLATPKIEIVDEVLSGFGTVIDSTIPQHIFNLSPVPKKDISLAQSKLEENGWTKNEEGFFVNSDGIILEIDISTSNVDELSAVAEITANSWTQLGVKTNIKNFDSSDLNPSVIRPRKFEALLFGIVISKDVDLYAFWHSSQRDDPGLNITNYTNVSTDKTLEAIRDDESNDEILNSFNMEITADIPAIFLYSPDFIYVLPDKLKGLEISNLISSEDRFMNVHEWYIKTDKVWEVFIN